MHELKLKDINVAEEGNWNEL